MLNDLKQLNLPEIEKKVLKFWKKNKIFSKSLASRQGQKEFIFYEGPPTANNKPGVHHLLARAFKDIILRYKTMRGYYVPRRAGWDTHGLPVELEIEKKLGFKNKQDIEKYGIAKFNQLAKESVWQYKKEWEEFTERIGFWLDLEHPYITYENSYIEKLWGIFKEINRRGFLYKGFKVVPWCYRCGTALSSHELAQGYQEVTDQSVYVKFRIKGDCPSFAPLGGATEDKLTKSNCSLLVWTTTPWTLPGNVALAINPQHYFVKVADPTEEGHWLILEKSSSERLKKVDPIFTSSQDVNIEGKDLLGLEYESLFDVQSLRSKNSYKIYPADFVKTGEGTGVVHTAVMYGEDDYQLGKKVGLPEHHTVNEQGKFTEEVLGLENLKAKDPETDKKIFAHLEKNKNLVKIEPYRHEYPFCWRCKNPILYYAHNSWFITMSKLRDELVKANQEINWIPEHLREGRFGEWLKEVKDWAISRERYWGTPLPIWEHANNTTSTNCADYLVVGSVEEIKHLGGQAPDDLHRPYIDDVILKCPDCGGKMQRIKEVADVWFDSGAMPFASGEYDLKRYPADYICEAIDQTRGWFYTLLAIAVLLGEGAPYKNVISLGHLLDKSGKKMSKSLGNIVDPWYLADKYGVDVIRWYFFTVNPPGEPKKFDETDLVKIKNKFHNLIFNSYVFFKTKNQELGIRNPADAPQSGALAGRQESGILDKWIISRLHETIKSVTEKLDQFDIGGAAKVIELLVEDLSRWYIRRSRKRPEAIPVLGKILLKVSKLIAPFTPFFAESLYRSLNKELGIRNKEFNESVHLEDWPQVNEELIDKNLSEQMAQIRHWASLALAKRAEAGIKVRQPLAVLRIKNPADAPQSEALAGKQELGIMENKELLDILADEINVKEIIFDEKIFDEIELDINITPELKKEGWLRELTRAVQDLRHEAGYESQNKITLFIEVSEKWKEFLNDGSFQKDISADRLLFEKTENFDKESTLKINEEEIWLAVKKIK